MKKRWAIIKDGAVETVFKATTEWAQNAHPGCVEVTENGIGRNSTYDPVTGFGPPRRDLAQEQITMRRRVQELLRRADWTTDPDNSLTPQERAQWRQWRTNLRTLLRAPLLDETTVIPEAPGPLDEV